ncbi:DUF433 domain-containing protein [Halobacteria archaeon AArc-m2/3/4]|uniref:DUF433 domain-containing protein n=1 Tax=Natronoglomus mannanivorans TaxID=2979990 RepID=A0AAP3E439_9EURY|nr:DUF433 domain-containing protein [Halobacteria archaeon AArc-xg1-1]MCU4972150.1 DUF433 domain-containing protein [Halobacteria archaeon AArc-m2/3/4]
MTEIVRTEGVLGGDPRIAGTRIGVLDVYELVVDGANPPANIADQLDLSLGDVYTALAYYYEHPEEMRELRNTQRERRSELARESLSPPNTAE